MSGEERGRGTFLGMIATLGLAAGSFAIAFSILFASIVVLNGDLYGRLTEKQTVKTPADPLDPGEPAPTLRVILHKILADENGVEASLVLVIDGNDDLSVRVRAGKDHLTASIRDGYAVDPVALAQYLTLDSTAANPRFSEVAVRSQRFVLPSFPSLYGFPFDDVRVRPLLEVRQADGSSIRFRTEIEKAVPGRILYTGMTGGIAEARLTRSFTEKTIVLLGAIVFLSISTIVIVGLFGTRLSKLEEIIAVAGYLLAATGVRDLLGFSRASGASALEVIVVGLPLVLLGLGIGISVARGRRRVAEEQPGPQDGSTA
jgi:hypothetical protein